MRGRGEEKGSRRGFSIEKHDRHTFSTDLEAGEGGADVCRRDPP